MTLPILPTMLTQAIEAARWNRASNPGQIDVGGTSNARDHENASDDAGRYSQGTAHDSQFNDAHDQIDNDQVGSLANAVSVPTGYKHNREAGEVWNRE